MQESIAESFSFEDSRKHKQMMVRNNAMEQLRKMEDRLLLRNQVRIEQLDESGATAVLIETATEDYELNEQISERFPAAIRTNNTLYECLAYSLISHLYAGKNEKMRTKLMELKTILYTDELEDLCHGVGQSPNKYHSIFTNDHLREILAKFFRLVEREQQEPNIYETDAFLLRTMGKCPAFVFALVLLLRKLAKKLSLLYEMELEDYSVYELNTDPQLDILWLFGQFFEVSFVLYQLDAKIIKQQKFKVGEEAPIYLVRNDGSDADWTYLCLRDHRLVREMSDIPAQDRPPNENFWKTNSSASQLKIITYFDRTQEQSPEMKTKRKVPRKLGSRRKHERSSQLKQQFSYEFKAITAETQYILSMGESALARLQRFVEQGPVKPMTLSRRTVDVKLSRVGSA